MVYKNITLITDTKIIKQIFTLVCSKLSLNLEIYPDDTSISKTDILIYEDIKYSKDNLMRYKSICSTLAVIAPDRMYEHEGTHLIKKPFLPSQLVLSISELLDSVKEVTPVIAPQTKLDDMSGEVDDLVDFIDSIDEVKNDEYSEDDQIEINASQLGHGGILDKKELDKLHDIISDDNVKVQETNDFSLPSSDDNSDWLELNDIIDNVIDNIEDIPSEKVKEDEILLTLNNFTMDELAPLLNKLNQDSIDKLSSGEDLRLKLRLEK